MQKSCRASLSCSMLGAWEKKGTQPLCMGEKLSGQTAKQGALCWGGELVLCLHWAPGRDLSLLSLKFSCSV